MNYELTAKEQRYVRTALRYLRFTIGTWKPLADALRYDSETIGKVVTGRRAVTAAMTLRVARFVDVSIDDLLTGKYVPRRTCPHCGHPPDDFSDEETVVDVVAGSIKRDAKALRRSYSEKRW